jgi:hypothetical protein
MDWRAEALTIVISVLVILAMALVAYLFFSPHL